MCADRCKRLGDLLTSYVVKSGQVDQDRIDRLATIAQVRSRAGSTVLLTDLLVEETIVCRERLRVVEEDLALDALGPYRILEVLGLGGMAVVFRAARQDGHDPPLALKVMRSDLDARLELEARFQREAEIWRSMSHKNIVPVHDCGVEAGRLFIAMRLVEGGDLATRLIESGPLAVSESVRLLHDLLSALAHAHALGVVHRDVKPQNVLLGQSDLLLSDFGLARLNESLGRTLTDTGTGMGTSGFSAPEQMRDAKRVGPRADLFSVGATWLMMLCGEAAWPALRAGQGQQFVCYLGGQLAPPVRDLLCQLLAPDPDCRPASARAVLDCLGEMNECK